MLSIRSALAEECEIDFIAIPQVGGSKQSSGLEGDWAAVPVSADFCCCPAGLRRVLLLLTNHPWKTKSSLKLKYKWVDAALLWRSCRPHDKDSQAKQCSANLITKKNPLNAVESRPRLFRGTWKNTGLLFFLCFPFVDLKVLHEHSLSLTAALWGAETSLLSQGWIMRFLGAHVEIDMWKVQRYQIWELPATGMRNSWAQISTIKSGRASLFLFNTS